MRSLKFLLVVAVCLGAVSIQGKAFCDSDEVNLEKIVVTPSRYGQDIGVTGSSISVISQAEIEDSNAVNITGILKPQADIGVTDFYGNSSKAQVDIRGFGGEMAALNNLVLVDGRRVNEVDLSGVDWTQIPLDQVEKIEIVRGGTGSVLYGDNAVSGVINILTKQGSGKPKINVGVETGSYDLNAQRLSLSGSTKNLSYVFSASGQSTNGYRNNSFLKSTDFFNKFEYDFKNSITAHFNFGFHNASYGLPGSLTESDIANYGRRYSKYGNDHGSDKDYYFLTGAKKEFEGIGSFEFDATFRNKYTFTDLVGGNGGYNPFRKNHIQTLGFTPKLKIDRQVFGKKNNFITGIDFYRQEYNSQNFNSSDVRQDVTHINKITFGSYLQEEFSILKNLNLIGGYRYEMAKYSFDFHDNYGTNVDTNIVPNLKAYNGGVAYNYAPDSTLFVNCNQSYRFPATDEFFDGFSTVNTSLQPQVSRNYEAGIRHAFNPKARVEFSVFDMNVKNELYTDPSASGGFGATANYPKTRHSGVEFGTEYKIFDRLKLSGNYSFTRAVFRGGSSAGNDIPMIPNQKANIGVQFQPLKEITLSVAENYVGSKYRLNDVNNSLDKMKQYFLTDLMLSYCKNGLTISGGINNLFNEYYYDFASYGVSSGNKVYYPSPGRNFSLKVDYKF